MQLFSNVRPLHVALCNNINSTYYTHYELFKPEKKYLKCLITKLSSPRPNQRAPKQFKLLSVGANKIELPEFLLRDWTHQHHKTVIRTKTIYSTLKDEGFKIRVQDERIECSRTPQLPSKQEEADTKMFLVANYACNRGVESVTIHTVNSHVAILACYCAPIIESRIIIKTGTGK